jgi:glycosyltransferase involved in cell wall biosynthesis
MRSPKIGLYDFRRIREKAGSSFSRKDTSEDRLKIINPVFFPFHKCRIVRAINKFFIGRQVRQAVKDTKSDKTIMWVSNPMAAYLTDIVKKDCLIYYCGDDFSQMPDVDKDEVCRQEPKLIEESDIIICPSVNLIGIMEAKGRRDNIHYVPQGVDYGHFEKREGAPVEKLEAIKKPIVGFLGLIAPWIDCRLLSEVARLDESINYCFIGGVEKNAGVEALAKLKNVYLIDKVPYEKVPDYLSYFSVAIIPFRKIKLSESVNPLKLMEYFALGLPVVSTMPIKGIETGDLMYVADNPQDFLRAIKSALKEDERKKMLRKDAAEQNDWKVRRQQVSEIIQKTL